MNTTQKKSLVDDRRGAVLAEFVVAIFPLLTIFFVFLQFSAIAVASLMVKHAAVVGARAAAVYSNEHENIPEMKGKEGKEEIDGAVNAALGPWSKYITVATEVEDRSTKEAPNGPYDLVTVKVTGTYTCAVPVGKVICPGGVKILEDSKSMAHQGARYEL